MQFNLLPLETILLAIVVLSFLVQLYYTFFIHFKLLRHRSKEVGEKADTGISVIIAARNESENLTKYLPSILEQDYPNFEVVVVNDRSWDQTEDVLKELASRYNHLKIVTVSEGDKFIAGKKFAVTMGIKAAVNEWLVFTDADCMPASDQWLKCMAQPREAESTILLGYSPYFKNGGILNALIRFETFYTAINYLGFALAKNPYMGVGRNMAYKKSLFFKGKGFASHMHIPSGDDDLFVNMHADQYNTAIMVHFDGQVWSEPETSWKNYFRQKRRHAGAGKLYKAKHKWSLSLQVVFQILFYTAVIALACTKNGLHPAIGVFALSLIIRCFIYPGLLRKLSYAELRWWYPLLDLLLNVFLMYNAIVSIFVKKSNWN